MARVLVAEDEPAFSDAVVYMLEREGLSAAVAADGHAALEQASTGEFDLVLLDLMLPGMSGLDVLRTLRRRGQDMPVLVVSARDAEIDKVVAIELGANDYITKPFSPES
ncbi:response regulator transcription factor [Phytohabitans flavus]|uniref:response regulator transcription factor n=1 Tax=Phytohabitans flavus TaxID=1076124 RepID=UPI0036456000